MGEHPDLFALMVAILGLVGTLVGVIVWKRRKASEDDPPLNERRVITVTDKVSAIELRLAAMDIKISSLDMRLLNISEHMARAENKIDNLERK